MRKHMAEKVVTELFHSAGIQVNGDKVHDILVKDERFFTQLTQRGALGLGESYVKGYWDCQDLATMCAKLAQRPTRERRSYLAKRLYGWKTRLWNLQDLQGAKEVTAHYNISNEMYACMLDQPYMQYSSAIFDNNLESLELAQLRKMKLICEKLQLKPGERVLEIGGGWGGLAVFMAKNYGVHVTSLNISHQQILHAQSIQKGLPIETLELDYRLAPRLGTFDKIVSVEMLEAVGPKNYRAYMEVLHTCLKPHGLAMVQTIGDHVTRTHGNLWILKYIFPNGHIPSLTQLGVASENLLITEHIENYGPDYDHTLMHWKRRFQDNWETIQAVSPTFNQDFYRMWNYYLDSSAGAFRAKHLVLWQILFSRTKSRK